jgi:hypothetical protein
MTGPWEQFQAAAEDGPWSQFANLDKSTPEPPAKKDEPKGKPWYTPGDITKSAGIGLVQGGLGLASLPGMAEWLGRKGLKLAGADVSEENKVFPTYDKLKLLAETVGGKFHEPESVAGQYARTGGEFATGLIGGSAGLPARALAAGTGAVASETAGQMTEGSAAEPWARMAGGILGSIAPSVGARMVTPAPAPARLPRDVAALDAEGIRLTAGQRSGSKPLQWAESVAGDTSFAGPRARDFAEAQNADFTRAVLRRIGENGDDWRAVYPQARDRIGQAFQNFGNNTDIRLDVDLFNDLNQAHATYTGLLPPNLRAPIVEDILQDLQPAAQALSQGGQPLLNGHQYNTWRSRLTELAEQAPEHTTQRAINGIIEALDGALQRSAPPMAAEAIGEARRPYRHLMLVRDVATRAGQDTARGFLSPAGVRGASTVGQTNKNYYASGQGDLTDLALAGESVLKPLPQSGTSPREQVSGIMTALGASAGGALGLPFGSAGAGAGIIAGALAPVAAKALASRATMHPISQSYLGNQLIPFRGAPSAGVRATGIAGPAIMDDAEAEDAAKARWLAEALKNLR